MVEWKDKFIESVLDKLREKGTPFNIIHQDEPIPLFTTSDITDALYEVFEEE